MKSKTIEQISKKTRDLILFDETKQDFGYDVNFLTQGSIREIWHKCIICNNSKKTKFRYFVQNKSLSHQQCKKQLSETTCLQRYGVKSHNQLESVKIKKKQTLLENYGKQGFKSRTIKQRRERTCLQKYNVDNPRKAEVVKQKIRRTKLKNETLKPKLIHPEYSKQYWLKQTFWDGCKINPSQDLPDQWSQGCDSKFEIICSCNNVFIPTFNDLTSGNHKSCGHNGQSYGEKELGRCLQQLFSEHKTFFEYSPNFLQQLRIDYAIPELRLAFEYDGLHHFQPVRFGGMSIKKAEGVFKLQQQRDKKKEQLLNQHNWTLIRVKYDQDIKQQLIEQLENVKHVLRLEGILNGLG